MNFFDIIFSILLIFFVIHSLILGTFKTLLTTIGLVGGYYAAEYGYEKYSGFALQYLNDINQARTLTYIGLFLFGALLGKILSAILRTILAIAQPSLLSRGIGAILGFVKGICICLVIFFVVNEYVPSFVDDLNRSLFTPWFLEIKQSLVVSNLLN
ncbi:MAG: CvpA family protein [Proteobacteria bacterium]|nr:CvpA family protein [Pseudomonadota bacterium]